MTDIRKNCQCVIYFTATVTGSVLAVLMIAIGVILLIIMIPFVLVKETVEEIKFRRNKRKS